MTRATLLALAERAEAADGADRELDRAIDFFKLERSRERFGAVPFYTASVDAALMLVPESKWWSVEGATGWGRASVDEVHEISATTPALALVAAACRAIAEEAPYDLR